jgi:pentatricopeptide repeat protein
MQRAARWQALHVCAAVCTSLADNVASGDAARNALAHPVFVATMATLSKAGQWQEALTLLDDMKACAVPAAPKVYNMAMTAVERGGQWQHAPAMVARMTAEGVQPDTVTYNTCVYF